MVSSLVTKVPNLVCDCETCTTSFLLELEEWWSRRCLAMGKSSKVKDTDTGTEVSPVKPVKPTKVGDNPASSSSVTAAIPPGGQKLGQQGDMLTALNGISGILKEGFLSLNKKIGNVSDGIDKLEDNMSKKFDDLITEDQFEEGGDVDDGNVVDAQPGAAAAAADPPPQPKTKKPTEQRQGEHELSDGEIEENQSEVLAEASKALDNDDSVGPPVKEYVAAFVNKAFTKPLKGDNMQKLKDKFPAPSNIDCLDVPRANGPIYLKLCATAKNKDRAIQENQAIFMRVVSALVKVTDTLAEHEKEGEWVKDTMKVSTDAITLAASLKKEWLKSRREDIKPSLPDDFKSLASEDIPLNAKNLFGDDLEGSIKTVENTNKIAKKMEAPTKKRPANQNKSRQPYKKKRKFFSNNNNKNNKNNNNNNNRRDNNDGGKNYRDDNKDFRRRGSRN